MLPYYAARFPTVEINYTFYRMPTEKLVAGWAEQTPSPYKLTLKAPRRITHDSRLKNCGDLVHAFCGVAGTLGDKLGALLFQLPPNLKKDLALFDAFLSELPPKVTAVITVATATARRTADTAMIRSAGTGTIIIRAAASTSTTSTGPATSGAGTSSAIGPTVARGGRTALGPRRRPRPARIGAAGIARVGAIARDDDVSHGR